MAYRDEPVSPIIVQARGFTREREASSKTDTFPIRASTGLVSGGWPSFRCSLVTLLDKAVGYFMNTVYWRYNRDSGRRRNIGV